MIMGVTNLHELFDNKYYRDLKGGILEAFGILYSSDLKIYVYPYQPKKGDALETLEDFKTHPRFQQLYNFLVSNRRIKDIENYDPDILQIFSREVLRKIRKGESGWEECLPTYVDQMIRDKRLFGYNSDTETEDQDAGLVED